jgi:hypothetical protein
MRESACLSASAPIRSATSAVALAMAVSTVMLRPQPGQEKGQALRKMARPTEAQRTLAYWLKHALQTLHEHASCVHSFLLVIADAFVSSLSSFSAVAIVVVVVVVVEPASLDTS